MVLHLVLQQQLQHQLFCRRGVSCFCDFRFVLLFGYCFFLSFKLVSSLLPKILVLKRFSDLQLCFLEECGAHTHTHFSNDYDYFWFKLQWPYQVIHTQFKSLCPAKVCTEYDILLALASTDYFFQSPYPIYQWFLREANNHIFRNQREQRLLLAQSQLRFLP